jgi:hypothetical protein
VTDREELLEEIKRHGIVHGNFVLSAPRWPAG